MIHRVTTPDGVSLAVRVSGDPAGVPTIQLSGGPGCVNYLPDATEQAAVRLFSPDPRGVGLSEGGPHDVAQALADLEQLRRHADVERWAVVGHSFGADLALAYAVEHPESVRSVRAVCGTGVQDDRDWNATYDRLKNTELQLDLPFDEAVHRSLLASWRQWIKQPSLLRRLSQLPAPVDFVVAEHDVRPSWPVEQLAALTPHGRLTVLPGVPHDLWHTHQSTWSRLVGSMAMSFADGDGLPR